MASLYDWAAGTKVLNGSQSVLRACLTVPFSIAMAPFVFAGGILSAGFKSIRNSYLRAFTKTGPSSSSGQYGQLIYNAFDLDSNSEESPAHQRALAFVFSLPLVLWEGFIGGFFESLRFVFGRFGSDTLNRIEQGIYNLLPGLLVSAIATPGKWLAKNAPAINTGIQFVLRFIVLPFFALYHVGVGAWKTLQQASNDLAGRAPSSSSDEGGEKTLTSWRDKLLGSVSNPFLKGLLLLFTFLPDWATHIVMGTFKSLFPSVNVVEAQEYVWRLMMSALVLLLAFGLATVVVGVVGGLIALSIGGKFGAFFASSVAVSNTLFSAIFVTFPTLIGKAFMATVVPLFVNIGTAIETFVLTFAINPLQWFATSQWLASSGGLSPLGLTTVYTAVATIIGAFAVSMSKGIQSFLDKEFETQQDDALLLAPGANQTPAPTKPRDSTPDNNAAPTGTPTATGAPVLPSVSTASKTSTVVAPPPGNVFS